MGLNQAIDKYWLDDATYRTASDTRVYAIGDIHGRLDLLTRLHAAILSDAEGFAGRKVAVYLGDYVDRGPDSKAVLDLLMSGALPAFDCRYLKGNHESALMDFLGDEPDVPTWAPKKIRVGLASWLLNGGGATLQSYGVDVPDPDDKASVSRAVASLQRAIPAAHREFLSNLSLSHADGDYRFVHAGIRPGVSWPDQAEHDLCWIREEFLHADEAYGFCVVHGHTIGEAPEVRPNRIGIDTGAVFSGHLTCLVLEGGRRAILQT